MAETAWDYTAILAAARGLRRPGTTVLDALQQQVPAERWQDLLAWLTAEAGVLPMPADGNAELSPLGLPDDVVRAVEGVGLRIVGEAETVLGLADPWDDEAVQRATTAWGSMPRLAAVASVWLQQAGGSPAVHDLAHEAERPGRDSRVVDFVDSAIRSACVLGASDVHFECDREGVTTKLRVDGVMQRLARMDDPLRAEEVISRLKVLARLDITERRVPQDGRFRFDHPDGALDLRVSIMPSVHGEDAVLRLLDKAQLRRAGGGLTLRGLGFSVPSAIALNELASLPHGMLLITGPTGSGKTTTVYAVLAAFNTGLEKIVTIEDPVEYELPGVLQIPVNDRKGLTFARGLRSILRHDPDRILVGEIRDAETAEIAVQSALTGHQVFTTVHANSIFDVIGRFRHFGLDMYGFTSALNGVVVQRLLRTCCSVCTTWGPPGDAEARWLRRWGDGIASVPSARGCAQCRGTGYRGRQVIAEVHAVDDGLRDLVTGMASLTALRHKIESDGPPGLQRQAVALVAAGVTTSEEVRRVVGWQ